MSYTTYTEDFIENLYTKIGVSLPHQLDLNDIAYKLGILVYFWENPSQVLFLGTQTYIFLDRDLSPKQLWQDFCHELCHVLLHSGSQEKMPFSWIEYQEWKANNFMLQACIPTFMLNKIIIPDSEDKAILLIQDLFNVEWDTAYKRLEQYKNNRFIYELDAKTAKMF
ncbi:ImmA/IrrE family metallo-endopeptidase [Lysinibacillus fusiformis]|uniref:ImmA/IrrE family metallo-endopeptidase n=1 Tax=Lysinibacillus fusiformis TaxID=28031 RepID=UPI002E9891C4|nr:ImmA/IrrE family metallo-endopeptidase [Lysinibacillus fusiformis]